MHQYSGEHSPPKQPRRIHEFLLSLRLIFQFTLQVVYIKYQLHFSKSSPEEKFQMQLSVKYSLREGVKKLSIVFLFLVFSFIFVSVFGRFLQSFNCLPTLLQNSCSSNPCHLNATCQTGFSERGYRCLCLQGFAGLNCKTGEKFSHNHSQPKRVKNFPFPDKKKT